MRKFRIAGSLLLLTVIMLFACVPAPKPEEMTLTAETQANRQLQTRMFATDDESRVLAASSAVLQDLGFLIDESEAQLGLLVGSKMRSARDAAEMVVMITLAILARSDPIYSEKQLMRISLVTTPVATGTKSGIAVRVNFQRIVYSNKGGVLKRETLGTPEIYQEFYAKLSKALFLEDQEI